jgi:hypothetical protein
MMLNGNEWVTLSEDATIKKSTHIVSGRAKVLGGGSTIRTSKKPQYQLEILLITNEADVVTFLDRLRIGDVCSIKAVHSTGDMKGECQVRGTDISDSTPHMIRLNFDFAYTTN